jgi:hypothetical protein
VLLTVKSNQKILYPQISCQFQGKRHIPFTATDHEKRHWRDTSWELRAKESPENIKANWPGSAWGGDDHHDDDTKGEAHDKAA